MYDLEGSSSNFLNPINQLVGALKWLPVVTSRSIRELCKLLEGSQEYTAVLMRDFNTSERVWESSSQI